MVSRDDLANEFHLDKSQYRHWSPNSQPYTGCDALLTALERGWRIAGKLVFSELFWRGNGRCIRVYHFDLQKGEEKQRMCVVWNPVVEQLVACLPLRVVVMNQRKDITTEMVRVVAANS
ncbi:MAG: hypothetical protein U0694_03575 [Anaerolineae bacterium]